VVFEFVSNSNARFKEHLKIYAACAEKIARVIWHCWAARQDIERARKYLEDGGSAQVLQVEDALPFSSAKQIWPID
jgi:hypothetical protein